MRRIFTLFWIVGLALALSSCGVNYAAIGNSNLNSTQVQLASNNFHVVTTLHGSASVSYVLFIGGLSQKQLYENAYADMMKGADLTAGSRAISNVLTEEQLRGFFPFYFERTVTVSANIIEFTR